VIAILLAGSAVVTMSIPNAVDLRIGKGYNHR
jgi:hypothetical protein